MASSWLRTKGFSSSILTARTPSPPSSDDIAQIQGKTILEAIKGEKLFSQVIFEITPNLHVIPSVLQFEEIDEWGRTGKELILRKELKKLEGLYDYVILDTPPNLRSETVFGLVAADVIPPLPITSRILSGLIFIVIMRGA